MKQPSQMCALILAAVAAFGAGCVLAPERYHEGYWDHDHDRYWHNQGWHPCAEGPEHCR